MSKVNRHIHSLKVPLFSLMQHSQVDINSTNRRVTHYISSDNKNHYDQILPVNGFDDRSFRNNPVVLFNHGFSDCFTTTPAKNQLEFLIANNVSTKVDGEYLEAVTEFLPEGQNQTADDIYRLYEIKKMHGWSKWFFPIGEPEYNSELDAILYKKWGIHEYSAVFIPVDGDAIGNQTNRMHALSLVKSPQVKHAIITQGAKDEAMHLVTNDEELLKFEEKLTGLETELNAIKNKDNTQEVEKQIHAITQNLFTEYNKIIVPKLQSFKNKFDEVDQKLLDLAKNQSDSAVQAIVEKHFLTLVKKTMGKID